MSNLTEQDLATIELIAEKLKQADKLIFEAKQEFYLMFPNDKPTAKDEVEYECLKDGDYLFLTKGKKYKGSITNGIANIIDDDKTYGGYPEHLFKPVNHTAQQQVEWKVGEWFKIDNILFLTTKIEHSYIYGNNQNNFETFYQKEFVTKPTEQEIFNHLKNIFTKKFNNIENAAEYRFDVDKKEIICAFKSS